MFVLGVGAQKAGTTWLFQQLASQQNFARNIPKEWHYWDKKYRVRAQELVHESERKSFFVSEISAEDSLESDYGYFASVVKASRNRMFSRQSQLVADLTPSYSGLPYGAFARIKAGFDEFGIDYRVVFLMRDPVERIDSAVRMNLERIQRLGIAQSEGVRRRDQIAATYRDYGNSWHCHLRTRYEMTLSNLERVFPAERLYVGMAETLLNDENIDLLAAFLGINPSSVSTRKARVGAVESLLTREIRQELVNQFRDTYISVEKKYPVVRQIWGGFEFC